MARVHKTLGQSPSNAQGPASHSESTQEESQVHNRMGACVDILFSYFIMPNYQVLGYFVYFLGFTDGSRVVNVVSSKFPYSAKRSPMENPFDMVARGTWSVGREGRDCVHFVVCVCACECGCIITPLLSHEECGHELGQFFLFVYRERDLSPTGPLALCDGLRYQKPSRIRTFFEGKILACDCCV